MANYTELITAIKSAIETGIDQPGQVSAAGRSVTYRSLADLISTLAKLEQQNASGTVRSKIKIGLITSGGAA